MPYGPAERLQEQVTILVTEANPTAIVQLSVLGEPAVPHLTELLAREGSEEKPSITHEQANAITRALGMIASHRALPALAARFKRIEGRRAHYRSSSSDAFRMTANALRKIGTAEALETLISRFPEFDVEHAAATFSSFGEPGMTEIVALLQDRTGDELALAIDLCARWRRDDATPFLLALLNATSTKDAVAAAYALARLPSVPRAPLMAAFNTLADRWAGRAPGYDDPDKDRVALYKAVLAAVYYSHGLDIVPDLLKWAAVEHTRVKERSQRYYSGVDRPIRDAILSFGKDALPHLEGNIAGQPADVKAIAFEIAHRIHEGEEAEKPEIAQHAERRAWV